MEEVFYREKCRLAKEEKKIVMVDPYRDTDGTLMVSYAVPFLQDGKFIGVLVIDLSINDIQKELVDVSTDAEDFKGLLTDSGVFVANAMDESLILTNLFSQIPEAETTVKEALKNGEKISKETICGTDIPGQILYVAVPIKGVDNQWCVDAITSVDRLTHEVMRDTIVGIIFNLLIILGVGALTVWILVKKISDPLSLIERAVVKISSYNLDIKEEATQASCYKENTDEIGSLVRAMGKLNANLNNIVSNISTHAQNTSATAEELTATAQATATASKEVS